MSDDHLDDLIHESVTFQVIAAIIEVHKILGFGFLDTVYEKALLKELILRGLKAEPQKEIRVFYKDEEVGSYMPTLL